MKKIFKRFIYILSTCVFILSGIAHLNVSAEENESINEKQLIVYYSNWSTGRQQISDLPWDRLSVVNHAFWRIEPNAEMTEFPIASINPHADFGAGMCFDQYEEMTAKYPNVKVLLSIGGWNDTKWFSEMASTETGRKSFIDSCVAFLVEYPFFSGIDIDWEFPGTSRNGEGEGFIGSAADKDNFTALMREMREAFDAAGLVDAWLTYCASTSTGMLKSGVICVDFAAVDPYVNMVNIMTYDMAGGWTGSAFHHSALYPGRAVSPGVSASEVVEYLLSLGVTPEKISIGTPLYSRAWIVNAENGEAALGRRTNQSIDGKSYFELRRLESETGWGVFYDEQAEAAYLFNSDPSSFYYQHLHSYENERSLQAKLDYINEMGLGGLIVWDIPGDAMGYDGDFPMTTRMAMNLGIGIFAEGYDGNEDYAGEAHIVIAEEDYKNMSEEPVTAEANIIHSENDNSINHIVWVITGIIVFGSIFGIYYLYKSKKYI